MLEIFSKFPATPLLTPRVSVTHYQSPLNHWLSGPEAYAEMCALRPDIKVIFTTGYTPKAKQLVSVIEKGAFILRKPYSLISLSQMIRGALEHHALSSSKALAVRQS